MPTPREEQPKSPERRPQQVRPFQPQKVEAVSEVSDEIPAAVTAADVTTVGVEAAVEGGASVTELPSPAPVDAEDAAAGSVE
ncbi:MAG: hypothetical protein KDA85_08170 [Planctomycetaceae bacterium]|nr:hypothetical protein [Planctomycetaceae bacterium]